MTILSQNIRVFVLLIFKQNGPYIFGHSREKSETL